MSNFAFLNPAWPSLLAEAQRAEALVYPDPRTACFYARRALELAIEWAYKSDSTLKLPYQDNLSALIHEPTFVKLTGPAVHAKCVLINKTGNSAVHSTRPVTVTNSFNTVRELFHVCYWLARTYSKTPPAPDLRFNGDILPKTSAIPPQTQARVLKLEADLSAGQARLTDLLAEHENLLTGKLELDAEVERLRAEVTAAKALNESRPDTHDYSEAETRDAFIDLLLRESGWTLSRPRRPRIPSVGHAESQRKRFR